MAIFDKSYELLQQWENRKLKDGSLIVYSNDKVDKGGETVFGISRKYWGGLELWKVVDDIKNKLDIDNLKINDTQKALLISNELLKNDVAVKSIKDFYYVNFWEKLGCNNAPNQAFADNLFLLGVNAGVKRAIKTGQEACNITVDGIIGGETRKAFFYANSKNVEKFTEIEIRYYKSIVEKDKSQERFLNGWIRRAKAV